MLYLLEFMEWLINAVITFLEWIEEVNDKTIDRLMRQNQKIVVKIYHKFGD